MGKSLPRLDRDELQRQLKRRFFELREQIRQELLRSDNERYQQIAGEVHDAGDDSVADLLVDVELAEIDREIEEIRDIDAALLRIAGDSYGVCSDCGDAISAERLHAYPTAKRCRPCQQRHERTHHGVAVNTL